MMNKSLQQDVRRSIYAPKPKPKRLNNDLASLDLYNNVQSSAKKASKSVEKSIEEPSTVVHNADLSDSDQDVGYND